MIDFLRGKIFGKKSARRYTKDYGKATTEGLIHDEDTLKLKEYLFEDPDFASDVRRFLDNVLIEAPVLVKLFDDAIADSTNMRHRQLLKKVRFYKLLRMAALCLIWNGNAFFEVRFNGKQLKEMYVIDPDTMRIHLDDSGRQVVKYTQEVNGSPVAEFLPEEIVHISIDQVDSGVWGNAFASPLKTVLLRKEIAEFYLQWLLQENKIQPLINVRGNLNEEAWMHIVSQFHAKANDPNLTQVINSLPEDEIEVFRVYDTSDFEDIQNYINEQKEQIKKVLQVPPVVAGDSNGAERSSADIQARLVFFNTIRSFQNLLVEELDAELLTKLRWNNETFKFPSVDQRVDVETIKMAKILRQDLGWTKEAVLEFLKNNNLKIPDVDKIFEDQDTDDAIQKNDGQGDPERESRQPRDKDGVPQREEERIDDKQTGVSNDPRQ